MIDRIVRLACMAAAAAALCVMAYAALVPDDFQGAEPPVNVVVEATCTEMPAEAAAKPPERRYTGWTKVLRPGWYLSLLRRIGRTEGTRYEPYLEKTTCDWHDGSGNLLNTLSEAQEWEQRECNAKHAIADVCALYGDVPMSELQQGALFEAAYALGRSRLLGFEEMNDAILLQDWGRAAYELQASYAGQVQDPKRFERLAKELRNEEQDSTDCVDSGTGCADSGSVRPAVSCDVARSEI